MSKIVRTFKKAPDGLKAVGGSPFITGLVTLAFSGDLNNVKLYMRYNVQISVRNKASFVLIE